MGKVMVVRSASVFWAVHQRKLYNKLHAFLPVPVGATNIDHGVEGSIRDLLNEICLAILTMVGHPFVASTQENELTKIAEVQDLRNSLEALETGWSLVIPFRDAI
jgi:hypothetical protein